MVSSFDGTTVHFTFGIPRGPDGAVGSSGTDGVPGPQGPPFASAVVDATNTLNPGESATVVSSLDGTNVHFAFGIPRGANGADGAAGPAGPQGPPFAAAVIDATNTLNPGESATVGASFDGTNVHFTFGIPRGADGLNGMPGEVTNSQINTAIASTALNPSAIANLGLAISDPPTQSELQQVVTKLDELITALRRV